MPPQVTSAISTFYASKGIKFMQHIPIANTKTTGEKIEPTSMGALDCKALKEDIDAKENNEGVSEKTYEIRGLMDSAEKLHDEIPIFV